MSGSNKSSALWRIDAAGLAVCIACAGAWYLLGWSPLKEAQAARQVLKREAHARETELSEMDEQRRAEEQRLAEIEAQIRNQKMPLERAEHINVRLKSVTELAAESQLRIDEIRPGSATVMEHYTGVPIRVAGQGGYAAVTAFLHQVKLRYRDLGVTGFELRGEPQALDKPTTYVVNLLWYAAPPMPRQGK